MYNLLRKAAGRARLALSVLTDGEQALGSAPMPETAVSDSSPTPETPSPPPWPYAHPAGHYYSPLPDLDAVLRDAERVFPWPVQSEVPGIAMHGDAQWRLLEHDLAPQAAAYPFPETPAPGWRYHWRNHFFAQADSMALYCLLRHLRPARIVEVGSGFSRAVMLDTRDRFLDGRLQLTCIEPFPERLRSLLAPGEEGDGPGQVRILEQRAQDVDLSVFTSLEAGDMLFIDSSHVSKIGSDVNRLFFEVLPSLPAGVVVHIHDVTYPFEYWRGLVEDGVAWNEAYLLRAFLTDSRCWQVLLCPSYLQQMDLPRYLASFPLVVEDYGSSFWMRKIC